MNNIYVKTLPLYSNREDNDEQAGEVTFNITKDNWKRIRKELNQSLASPTDYSELIIDIFPFVYIEDFSIYKYGEKKSIKKYINKSFMHLNGSYIPNAEGKYNGHPCYDGEEILTIRISESLNENNFQYYYQNSDTSINASELEAFFNQP